MRRPGSPATVEELLARARDLCGHTAGELARELGVTLPVRSVRGKGSIGELVELALGASAGNQDGPDFPGLGVELKTVPMDPSGRVRESTYVCAIDIASSVREEWATSRVWRKLRQVLWVPVAPARGLSPAQRGLGRALLWRPEGTEDEGVLRGDWLTLTGRMAVGGIDEITAHLGEALQVRPKARDGAARVHTRGPEGEALRVMPRGFYLRARYVERVLWRISGGPAAPDGPDLQ